MARCRLLHVLLILANSYLIYARGPNCGHNRFGSPTYADCRKAISRLPQDKTAHYFVEQDLRTTPSSTNWARFVGSRGPYEQPSVMQLPKWWSEGKCNIAIFGYTHDRLTISNTVTTWYSIFNTAADLAMRCGIVNDGGSSVVPDTRGSPALSLFMWEDGAPWDWLMNYITNDPFPQPPDPTMADLLLGNGSFIEQLQKGGKELFGNP